MKKYIVLFLVMITSAYAQYGATPPAFPATPSVPYDCSHLSQQEQSFAQQLSVMHRTLFCRHFSVSQRIEAMTLAATQAQDLQGQSTSISPDEAVEIVMKGTRDTQPPSQTQEAPPTPYSYPPKRQQSPYTN